MFSKFRHVHLFCNRTDLPQWQRLVTPLFDQIVEILLQYFKHQAGSSHELELFKKPDKVVAVGIQQADQLQHVNLGGQKASWRPLEGQSDKVKRNIYLFGDVLLQVRFEDLDGHQLFGVEVLAFCHLPVASLSNDVQHGVAGAAAVQVAVCPNLWCSCVVNKSTTMCVQSHSVCSLFALRCTFLIEIVGKCCLFIYFFPNFSSLKTTFKYFFTFSPSN